MRTTFGLFAKYRFLLLDFTGIMRQYASVRTHYQALHQLRQQQFAEAIERLIDVGLLRADIEQQQYEYLGTHFNMISDFWLAYAEILRPGDVDSQLGHFTEVTFSLLIPYLTEAGQQAYYDLPK